MGNFWLGAIFGWVVGELGLCFVIVLVNDREEKLARRDARRALAAGDDDERDSA